MPDATLDPDQVPRTRLRELIEARYGGLDTSIIGRLSRAAGISHTTLSGYFGLLENRRQTERLREGTLRKVLLALNVDPFQFLRASQDRQLELWPAEVSENPAAARVEGSNQLRTFADLLRELPAAARIRASRFSISAGIDNLASAGEAVPDEAYELLRELDGLNREMRGLRLLA